jgi:hypothetical protein
LQQRGLKWCPKNPKPYIMNLSLSLSLIWFPVLFCLLIVHWISWEKFGM